MLKPCNSCAIKRLKCAQFWICHPWEQPVMKKQSVVGQHCIFGFEEAIVIVFFFIETHPSTGKVFSFSLGVPSVPETERISEVHGWCCSNESIGLFGRFRSVLRVEHRTGVVGAHGRNRDAPCVPNGEKRQSRFFLRGVCRRRRPVRVLSFSLQ